MRWAAGWRRCSWWRPGSRRRPRWLPRSRSAGVTLWTWRRDFAAGGVLALVRARTGPKGPIKLTAALAGRIARLDAAGETLLKIAARTGVSTATVRVALGRVTPRSQAPVEPDEHVDELKDEPKDGPEVADLVVLAPRCHAPPTGSPPGSGTWSRRRW